MKNLEIKKKFGIKVIAVSMCMALTMCSVTGCGAKEETQTVSEQAQADDLLESVMYQIAGATPTTSAGEDGKVTKEETVYVMADPSGATHEILVSDWIKNRTGSKVLEDVSDLDGIVNVKGNEAFSKDGDKVTWEADGQDIFYQGTTERELPVNMTVSYYLDGEAIEPEALIGKTGQVTIRFDYENTQKQTVMVDGKETEIYTPFAMLTGLVLDSNHFSNIRTTNGKVITKGDENIVVGMTLPGLQESLDLANVADKLESDEAKEEIRSIELPSYFELSAYTTDFRMDMSMSLAVAGGIDTFIDVADSLEQFDPGDSISQLTDAMDQLEDGGDKLKDGGVALAEGSDALRDGTAKLKDGAGDLAKGTADLKAGVGQLSEGAQTLSEGADRLNGGAGDLQNGASQLRNGTAELSTGAATLYGGTCRLSEGAATVDAGMGELQNGIGTVANSVNGMKNAFSGDADGQGHNVMNLASQISSGLADLSQLMQLYDQEIAGQADAGLTAAQVEQAKQAYAAYLASLQAATAQEQQAQSEYEGAVAARDNALAQLNEACQGTTQEYEVVTGYDTEVSEESYVEPGQTITICEDAAADRGSEDGEESAESGNDDTDGSEAGHSETVVVSPEVVHTVVTQKECVETESVQVTSVSQEEVQAAVANYSAAEEAVRESSDQLAAAQASRAELEETAGQLAAVVNWYVTYVAQTGNLVNNANAYYYMMEQYVSNLQAGSAGLNQILTAVNTGINSSFAPNGIPALTAGAQQLKAGTAQLSSGANELKAGASALSEGAGTLNAGADTLYQGTITLHDGTSALAQGAGTLWGGTLELGAGSGKLYDGATQLYNGCGDLYDGADSLSRGAHELSDGLATLRDGLYRLDEEGIGRLTGLIGDEVQPILDRVSAIHDAGAAYTNYSGTSDEMESSVKFIYKTDALK